MKSLRHRLLKLALAATAAVVPLTLAGSAQAAPADPLGFQIQVPEGGLVVHENAGAIQITVTRDRLESLAPAQVRYITSGNGFNPSINAPFQCGSAICTATADDFTSVKGELDFKADQPSATFSVPITDHGFATSPKTFQVSLFGPSPIGLGPVSKVPVTILEDDPATPAVPGNPLALPVAPTSGNPLAGASMFVDPQSQVASAAKSNRALNVIASQPGTARFGVFSYTSPYVGTIQTAVSRYLTRAAATAPGSVPLLATYTLVHGAHGNGDTPAQVAAYQNFINGFAQGIGSYRAVLFLEEDSVITMPSLNRVGQQTRINELSYAINTLTANCPHLVIYLDSGAADALPAKTAAGFLNRAGISKIQGFFLNSTHFDSTSKEIRYGNQISAMTGGKHFVVNTGTNGQGPLTPKDIVKSGNEVLCNPVNRGLGAKPTTKTGYPKVDAFEWTTNPGESGGQCHDQPGYELPGAPPTGAYWPKYALMLVKYANFKIR
ncbi:MAG TPA: glycoside hydrolase family 6 protein [Solirubrobacteraceae bacterium]